MPSSDVSFVYGKDTDVSKWIWQCLFIQFWNTEAQLSAGFHFKQTLHKLISWIASLFCLNCESSRQSFCRNLPANVPHGCGPFVWSIFVCICLSGSPLDAHSLCSLSPGCGQSCWAVRFQTCSRSWPEKVNSEQRYFGRDCVCSIWANVCFCVYCQQMKWPQMTLNMHARIIENLISCNVNACVFKLHGIWLETLLWFCVGRRDGACGGG